MLSVLLLATIGLVTVHSASAVMAVDYFPRQAGWVAIGLVLLVVVMSIDYHVLLDLSVVLYGLGIAALVGVLGFGVVRGGAANWLQIGPWQFQPSEFAKLATCLFLARDLAGLNARILSFRQILAAVAIVAVQMLLVAIEPDMGGAAMFAPLLIGTLLVAGIRIRLLIIAVVTGLVLVSG
ncbi:MAG: FtsW/RodA/SpoVE family cell cycle protein, partial [Pseudonocardiaceae bacterium]